MKKRTMRRVVIAVLAVAVVAAAALALRPRGSAATGQQYKAVDVVRGDLQVTVHGSGALEPIDTQNVHASATGKAQAVLVEDGDTVVKGQPIAVLKDDVLEDTIADLKEQIVTQDATVAATMAGTGSKTLTAPVKGRVKAVFTAEGEDVQRAMSADQALLLLSTDGRMKVEFTPAAGVAVEPGQPVNVKIGKKSVDGFVQDVPDGTNKTAVVLIEDDSLAAGKAAQVVAEDGTALGEGKLAVNRPLLITAYSGTVDRVYVEVGDEVKAGKRLVRLDGAVLNASYEAQLVKRQQLQDDLDDAYADLAALTITAPCDGVVSGLTVKEGDAVTDGMALCTVQDVSGFQLVIAADELDVPSIAVGQTATVTIDALPGQTATATVTRISPLGVKANDITTYDVTLTVDAPAGALATMTAAADILTKESKSTLLVPVEALVNEQGKTYVWGTLPGDLGVTGDAKPAEGQEREKIEVTTGLINDSQVEILTGLAEGDTVAVPLTQGEGIAQYFGGQGGGMAPATSGSDQ